MNLEEVQRELDRVMAERDHLLKCVRYYADPEQWTENVDDRGRDTMRWRWGDDGGLVARTALARLGKMREPVPTGVPEGAHVPASGAPVVVGDAGASGWDSSMHEPADEPSWMAGMSRLE